jgi:peptidoglycan L-alanyl-D-glutamate endopeptidase CwlK
MTTRDLERLKGINPILIDICIEASKTSPIPFGIPRDGGLRTAERQNYLYKKHRSKCDGYVKKSYHQSGNAFDIYAIKDGVPSWDKQLLTQLSNHILRVAEQMNVKLTWGGNFKSFKDMPHFQI